MGGVVTDDPSTQTVVALGSLRNPLCHTVRQPYGTKFLTMCGIMVSEPYCCYRGDDDACGRPACPVCEDLCLAEEMPPHRRSWD